ncbi:chemotaxis protein CheW [Sphingomonas silueang]|uniref:chemotaxis protein CheW n=1 Tax=Sphingomonas silueang TaxID=3156617 RepID=UPI0032B52311
MSGIDIIAEGLDPAAVAAVLRARQRALAAPDAGPAAARETLLAFALDGVAHALPIAAVRAVAAVPPIAAVPQAPPALLGLVAWRGTVVNLFAPGPALGRAATTPGAMILLRHEAPRIALAVDTLTGVVTAAAADGVATHLSRLVATDTGHVTRIEPALLVELLLPPRLQEG